MYSSTTIKNETKTKYKQSKSWGVRLKW
jgi:hypothetical protein